MQGARSWLAGWLAALLRLLSVGGRAEGVPAIGMLRVGGDTHTLSDRGAAAEEEEGYQLPR